MTAHSILGLALGLTTFLVMNVALSAGWLAAWMVVRTRIDNVRRRAGVAFACRIAPPMLAALITLAFFVPAWIGYEPVPTSERAGIQLLMLAAASAFGLLAASWRSWRLAHDTNRLLREWNRGASSFAIPGTGIRAASMENAFPTMAVVGIFRPQLFVATRLRSALLPEELSVAAAHELAHARRGDNLRRALMLARRALLPLPGTAILDRDWSRASELAADDEAASTRAEAALDLASALVKIARLISDRTTPLAPMASFVTGDGAATIEERVRLLAERAGQPVQRDERPVSRFAPPLAATAFMLAFVAMAPALWPSVHRLVEVVVPFLS